MRLNSVSMFDDRKTTNDWPFLMWGYPHPGIFNAVDADKDGFATLEEVPAYFRNAMRGKQ